MYIDTTAPVAHNTLTIRANNRDDDADWSKVKRLAAALVEEHGDMWITGQYHYLKVITLRSSGVSMTLRGLECRFTKALTYIND
jgi:hypothetical protein